MNIIPSIGAADAYVSHVSKVTRSDPGRRAALRRSLGRPVEDIGVRRAHAVVAPWLPHSSAASSRGFEAVESAYYTVAALVAALPADRDRDAEGDLSEPAAAEAESQKDEREQITLGRTLGLAVRDGKVNPDTVEGRLHLLCRQHVAGLHRHLPGVIRLLQARDVQIDLARLLVDLSCWGTYRDQVAKRWLQDFYRAMNEPKDTGEDNHPNTAGHDGRESED